jgi:alpha-beta hydrolase superfamily lysophospholipase
MWGFTSRIRGGVHHGPKLLQGETPMSKPRYEMIPAHDGALIHTARFEPEGEPAGVIHFLHGFGEGVEHYERTADFFTRNGYACVAHDLRGYGKMPYKTRRERQAARGIAPGYESFLEDLQTIKCHIDQWYPGLPAILFGFSMGANIIINYLLKCSQEQYDKVILESPWLRLYRPLPDFAEAMANYIGKISPNLRGFVFLKLHCLSRDMEKMNRLKACNIYHNRISFRLYSEMAAAGEYAIQNAARITVPVLLLCAGQDKIVSPMAIREFSKVTNENITFIEYPDGYHYLHLDIIGDNVLKDILSFCKRHVILKQSE